ncbi:MAG: ATP-binding protein [Gammaproteobacteria bacterium]|nr:ATP-binding protein [Gammaproteobacteria bacterium]
MLKRFIKKLVSGAKERFNKSDAHWLKSLSSHPNLFHLNRNSVSLAFGIGIFCAFIPLPIQTIATVFLSLAIGANLPLALTVIWISNPFTIPPMFFLTYKLGSILLNSTIEDFNVELNWQWFSNLGSDILFPLFLGSFLCGILFGLLGYFIVLMLWRWQIISDWETRRIERKKKKVNRI